MGKRNMPSESITVILESCSYSQTSAKINNWSESNKHLPKMKSTTYITEITTQKYERIGMVTVKDGGRLDSENSRFQQSIWLLYITTISSITIGKRKLFKGNSYLYLPWIMQHQQNVLKTIKISKSINSKHIKKWQQHQALYWKNYLKGLKA